MPETPTTTTHPSPRDTGRSPARRGWMAFTRWRRSRPFWGGAFALAGGLTILFLPAGRFTVLTLPGTAGFAGFLLGGLIAALGLLCWAQPEHRGVAGVTIVMLALASFVYSNLGGFGIGMLTSLVGGALAVAWTPRPDPTPDDAARPVGTDDTPTDPDPGTPASE
ncbi:DUF6114 domain-containing protein [Saccharomonospora iraqiensis]|uniref:DUF6114 domain-containing protein n=1 Tax=Saccharomonospora iraqiensis TaxID=52698 RepID=UPI0012B56516|nr:DUF6114 domain-containing protein [Saccharomonospora iraqiensis]